MSDDGEIGEAGGRSTLVHDLRGPLITLEGFVGEIDQALSELEALLADEADANVVAERLATLLAEDLRPCLDFVGTAARSMHGRIDSLTTPPADPNGG